MYDLFIKFPIGNLIESVRVIILLMAPLLNELFSKIELFYIKIGAINNYFTLIW